MKRTLQSPILAVDDSDEDMYLFRLLLKRVGATAPFVPMLSAHGVLGWLEATIRAANPGDYPFVCFLDVKMPQIGGFEILRWIRERQVLNAIPVVMMSSSDHERDIRQAFELGAQAYLTKYPSTTVLSEVLAHASAYVDGNGTASGAFEASYNLLHANGARLDLK